MTYKEKVEQFLHKKSDKPKMVVIYGPTGSGKTTMSIDIAKILKTEIIGTDSRQIFQELNIGTGKITEDEKQGVIHHMIDIIPADREYSVGEFKKEAEKIIGGLQTQNKIPILCGGTGLYIDSLIYDFNIPSIAPDPDLRKRLEEQAEQYGNEFVYKKLQELDPEYAKELHPNNLRYVIRGIEVMLLTGKSKLDSKEEKKLKYDILFLTPDIENREYLYNRINKRVDMMFDEGLVQEVQALLKKYNKDDFGMRTIGYKEVIDYLDGNMSLEECIELVRKHNRNYAKRQCTWFRKYDDVIKENEKLSTGLFTKSRILFLVVVFVVILMPLLYRELSFLLK